MRCFKYISIISGVGAKVHSLFPLERRNIYLIPGKAIRLSENTNSANATITQGNAKNVTTNSLEKTEDSTKVNQDHALKVENMSELEKMDLLACKITAKLEIANEEKKRKEIAITESNEFWIDPQVF